MNYRELTIQVCRIAKEIGAFQREERKKFNRNQVEEKGTANYVSYVDKESERRIVDALSLLVPEAGFIAEEGTGSLDDQDYCWVVDPLDGTTNFIHDIAPYCVSIALRNKQEVLLGVVYEVCRDECFYAWKGDKAYLNGEEIRVSPISDLCKALILYGFPYNAEVYKPTILHLVEHTYGFSGGNRLMGACAAELCYIACGRAEVRIESFLGPWDVAAGAFILQLAGGRVTDYSGGNFFWSGVEVLASNGGMHDIMLGILHAK